ncbi:MAG TPA: class I SAM-dependent methyltransferase [Jatrophihabitans sp.]|nr:class I SAM-dependent methyltransferase [Jatrophihabitans sp.]
MSQPPTTRWAELSAGRSGSDYAARFAALAAAGQDPHGEARFCAGLLPPPATVLDAGCGTGRVAIRLAELGCRCTGVDLDPSMLAEARRAAPELDWLAGDLTGLAELLDPATRFDLVVAAGNVIPLLAPGTLTGALASLAATLGPDGLLVTGFGLAAGHLPRGCPVTGLAEYDAAAELAGLSLLSRHAGWQTTPLRSSLVPRSMLTRPDEQAEPVTGYAVSVHRR